MFAGIDLLVALFSRTTTASHVSFISILCAILTGAFGISLLFFTLFHVKLVCDGKTTLEMTSNERVNQFISTRRKNWEAVFGASPWYWFLPVDTLTSTGYDLDLPDDARDDVRGLLDQQQASSSSPASQQPPASISSNLGASLIINSNATDAVGGKDGSVPLTGMGHSHSDQQQYHLHPLEASDASSDASDASASSAATGATATTATPVSIGSVS